MAGQDKIIIKDLLLRGIIGFQDWEREKKQDIRINVTLLTDMRTPGETDDPADALDYKRITKAIIAHVDETGYQLVEALATAIARICVVDHDAARAIVRVEKPGALRFSRSVGVEIDRERADFE